MRRADYIVVWTDTVPDAHGLKEAAQARGGELLAAAPIHDMSEQDSRAAPAGLAIARFGNAENAAAWFATVGDRLDGTALLVAGAADPVWWPPEVESARPAWYIPGRVSAGSPWPVRVCLG
jgi:hypothetical protein